MWFFVEIVSIHYMAAKLEMQLVLSVLTTAIAGVIGWLFHKLKKHEEKRELIEKQRLEKIRIREQAITDALRAFCHDRILQFYKEYKSGGTIPTTDLETVTSLYNAYHALGGIAILLTGTITPIDVASNIVTGICGYMGQSLLEKNKKDKEEVKN